MYQSQSKKLIGKVLLEAHLVSPAQIEIALEDKRRQSKLQIPSSRLGEILACHGWIKQQTVDFFVEQWPKILQKPRKEKIGYYLQEAALLSPLQINWILQYQASQKFKSRFGEIASQQGWVKPETLCFFLQKLLSENHFKVASREGNLSEVKASNCALGAKEVLHKYMMGSIRLQRSFLDEVDFNSIILEYANLTGSLMRKADLAESILDHAKLTKANLWQANLSQASLRRTNLSQATLHQSNLAGAFLHQANFEGADLRNANLRQADLENARLDFARLEGADLRGANLVGASLINASYDLTTRFDATFNPLLSGMILVESSIDMMSALTP